MQHRHRVTVTATLGRVSFGINPLSAFTCLRRRGNVRHTAQGCFTTIAERRAAQNGDDLRLHATAVTRQRACILLRSRMMSHSASFTKGSSSIPDSLALLSPFRSQHSHRLPRTQETLTQEIGPARVDCAGEEPIPSTRSKGHVALRKRHLIS